MYLRPTAMGRRRIVVMDRDAATLSHICELLESKGYQVVGAEATPTACQLVNRRRVDLVLTTIAFPEAERETWLSALGHLDVHVPVIAMCDASSAHALDLFDTANEFGAAAVLRRPFTASTLLQMVAEFLPGQTQAQSYGATSSPAEGIDWTALLDASAAIH
jgi:DNA-binding NtrC family response regulator